VNEAGRDLVVRAVGESSRVATAMVSYAEARATFARLLREGGLTEEEHSGVVRALDLRWPTYERPAVTDGLVRLAGDLAQQYALRGYDSIQLASAFVCQSRHREFGFLSFDEDLDNAAMQMVSLYRSPEDQNKEPPA
jgi:predicted nucleic acid-binding protein